MARQWIGPIGGVVDEDGSEEYILPFGGVLGEDQASGGGVAVGPAQPAGIVAATLPPGIVLGSLALGGGISVVAFAGAASTVLQSLVLVPAISAGSRVLGGAPGAILGALTLSALFAAARSAVGPGLSLLGSLIFTAGGTGARTESFISPPPNGPAEAGVGSRTILRMAGGKKG